jgi:hypothetical protein
VAWDRLAELMPRQGQSLVAALLLAVVYLRGQRLLPRQHTHPRRWLSAAAGASMAYVFLDVLPELGVRHRAFLGLVGSVSFAEHRLYALALVGFVFLYALDEMVQTARGEEENAGEKAATRIPIFWIHIAGYALYGAIIGDAVVSRGEHGALSLWLYAAAMVFHLLVVTSALGREHGHLYHTSGRWVLAASVVAGWAVAAVAPLSEIAMSRLFAFVAGGVLMTSANEELPREKGGRFGWFALGAGAYGTLLLLT